MGEKMTLIVYVTDARSAYQANLLAAMGRPIGSHHVFRHGKRWIDSDTWEEWSTESLTGTDVVVAYLTGNEPGLPSACAYPVRSGVVVGAEKAGEHGLLTVRLNGWCGVSFANHNPALSTEITSKRGPEIGSFVLLSQIPVEVTIQDEIAAWSEVANQLRALPEFKTTPMISIQAVRTWPRCRELKPSRGKFHVERGRSFEIDVIAIAPKQSSPSPSQVKSVSTAPGLRVMTNASIDVGFRLNRSQVLVYASEEERAPTADVTFLVEDGQLDPQVRIRLRLKSSVIERLNGLLLPGGSAALAAGAGILPQDAPIWLKVVMVLVGSAGVGIATFRAGKKT
jgi:hypothetical protein